MNQGVIFIENREVLRQCRKYKNRNFKGIGICITGLICGHHLTRQQIITRVFNETGIELEIDGYNGIVNEFPLFYKFENTHIDKESNINKAVQSECLLLSFFGMLLEYFGNLQSFLLRFEHPLVYENNKITYTDMNVFNPRNDNDIVNMCVCCASRHYLYIHSWVYISAIKRWLIIECVN